MERTYNVWSATSTKDHKITCFFISDITKEEIALKIVRPRLIEFHVNKVANQTIQEKRAFQVCHLLNGFVALEITNKGRGMLDKMNQANEEDDDPIAMELAKKETFDLLNKISGKKTGFFKRLLTKLRVT